MKRTIIAFAAILFILSIYNISQAAPTLPGEKLIANCLVSYVYVQTYRDQPIPKALVISAKRTNSRKMPLGEGLLVDFKAKIRFPAEGYYYKGKYNGILFELRNDRNNVAGSLFGSAAFIVSKGDEAEVEGHMIFEETEKGWMCSKDNHMSGVIQTVNRTKKAQMPKGASKISPREGYFFINTTKGDVLVKDFRTSDNFRGRDDYKAWDVASNNYCNISYQEDNSRFMVNMYNEGSKDDVIRKQSEDFFVTTLDISRSDACKLNVDLYPPLDRKPQVLKLSFCK